MIYQAEITDLMKDVATLVSAVRDDQAELSLVELIAELRTIKTVRSAMSAPNDSLKDVQDSIEARIMAALRDSGQTMAGGEKDKVSIQQKTRLQIGPGGVHVYKTEINGLIENGTLTPYAAMSLFPAKINDAEYKALVNERGITLACVEEVEVETLSLTKL